MQINITDRVKNKESEELISLLKEYGFTVNGTGHAGNGAQDFDITPDIFQPGQNKRNAVEIFFNSLDFDFDNLPFLTEGESKIIRQLTDTVVIEKFKPTVYSYTHNRYGIAEGTDDIRMKFSSALYRRLADYAATDSYIPVSSFIAEINNEKGHYMVQWKVDTCNLEIRIKRYHIGSPLHRYRYTEQYSTLNGDGQPLQKWSRFDFPVVCFDWRNPLTDHEGNRLADEPVSDDYAAIWMKNTGYAKEMAKNLFCWIEDLFSAHGVVLVDMCIFVDKNGSLIYGEISPDCMRIRWNSTDLETANPLCKDNWRMGNSPDTLFTQYNHLYDLIFGE